MNKTHRYSHTFTHCLLRIKKNGNARYLGILKFVFKIFMNKTRYFTFQNYIKLHKFMLFKQNKYVWPLHYNIFWIQVRFGVDLAMSVTLSVEIGILSWFIDNFYIDNKKSKIFSWLYKFRRFQSCQIWWFLEKK